MKNIDTWLEHHPRIKHWLKIDHIAFLLMAPAIIFDIKKATLFFWATAVLYDIYEQRSQKP